MKLHEPKTTKKGRFSFLTSIWIVPIAAFFISLWLAYQYFSQLGAQVTILFKQNSGLQANQSYIKYRDVPIGVIKEITLDKKTDGVIVTARMNKEADVYLNESTKFWIVKPEVGTSGISGLDTLVSGTYIQMYAKKKDKNLVKKEFIGLDKPYIDRDTTTGYRYHLSAPDSRNLHIGSPVYYRKILVGEIEDIKLNKEGTRVDFEVFIKHPYTNYISKETKFWLMSNISFTFNHSGFNLDLAPVSHIINGGIAFDTPAKIIHEKEQGISHIFFLYKDRLAMQKKRIGLGKKHKHHFFMLVDEPIAKLDVGAPVEFFGFQVGSVVAMHSDFDNKIKKIISTIEVVIDTSAFAERRDEDINETKSFFIEAVKKGLRAKIAQSDPITGSQYIELVFEAKAGQREIEHMGAKEIIPTVGSNDVDIAQKLSLILDKINSLRIEELIETLKNAIDENSKQSVEMLKELNIVAKNLKKISSDPKMRQLPERLSKILDKLKDSLDGVNALLKGESKKSVLSKEITIMLKEITNASKSIDRLSKKLEKKPNSLIFGDE